jgi:hypothetical protein
MDVGRPTIAFGEVNLFPRLDLMALSRRSGDLARQLDLGSQRRMQVV